MFSTPKTYFYFLPFFSLVVTVNVKCKFFGVWPGGEEEKQNKGANFADNHTFRWRYSGRFYFLFVVPEVTERYK
jgi:hypothetical protein